MSYGDTEIVSNWAGVVERIRSGDQTGVEDLYSSLSKLISGNLLRVIGPQSFEDSLHEVVVIVLEAIQSGDLRDPVRVMGFMRTVARRQMVAHIREAISQRQRFAGDTDSAAMTGESPEGRAAYREQIADLRAVLQRLSQRDQEIIERFYFHEQCRDQICLEMHLSETQFRLYKSRALAKCSRLARSGRVACRGNSPGQIVSIS